MTMSAAAVPVEPVPRRFTLPPLAESLEHLTMAVALGSLALVTRADGGRDVDTMVWALPACLPALLATRPWARVSPRLLALLAVLPLSAFAVSYLTPTQFAYSRDLSVWAFAAVLAASTAAYVRTTQRRLAVTVFVCVLGFLDLFTGFSAWRYHDDPGRAMVGTFYQQDMFGAFCVAIALAAAALAMFGPRPWHLVGWCVAPVLAVGCVLSTSRAGQGLLVLGVVGLAGVAALSDVRRRALLSLVGLLALGTGLLFLVTGPLVFSDSSGSPLDGTTRRSGSDSLDSSFDIRLAYWRAALDQFRDAPLVGEGFGSFGLTFFERAPLGAFGSRYAHNGFLQGLGEGGLLFGLPLLVAGVGAVGAALRALLSKPSVLAAPLAMTTLALVGHTLVDFDWSFPALAGLLAVAAAASRPSRVRAGGTGAKALVALILLATLAASFAVHGYRDDTKAIAASPTGTAAGEEAADRAAGRGLPNPLLWQAVLVSATDPASARTQAVSRALERTASMAVLDPNLQLLRSRVVLLRGDREAALAMARDVVDRTRDSRPDLVASYAELLSQAGEKPEAVRLLTSSISRLARPDFPLPDNVWRLVDKLQQLTGVNSSAAVCGFEETARAFRSRSRPAVIPVPTGRCSSA